jgi:hypothetical protein
MSYAGWVWMVPLVVFAHAASVGQGNTAVRLGVWWDWPVGAVVAGLAGATCANGMQLYGGWEWIGYAVCAGLTYAVRGITFDVEAYQRIQVAWLVGTAMFVTTMALVSPNVGLAMLAGPVPCLQGMMVRCADAVVGAGGSDTISEMCNMTTTNPPTLHASPPPSKTRQAPASVAPAATPATPTTTTPSPAPAPPPPKPAAVVDVAASKPSPQTDLGAQVTAPLLSPWADSGAAVPSTAPLPLPVLLPASPRAVLVTPDRVTGDGRHQTWVKQAAMTKL